jgi:hypothetical protein
MNGFLYIPPVSECTEALGQGPGDISRVCTVPMYFLMYIIALYKMYIKNNFVDVFFYGSLVGFAVTGTIREISSSLSRASSF